MKKTFILLALVSLFSSCKEDFLDESPKDFLSSANAYVTHDDFTASVNNLYYLVRRQFYSRDENRPFDFLYGTDIVYDGENNGTQRHSRMSEAYAPSGQIATVHWNLLYKTIAEANTIIDRSAASNMTEEETKDIVSQARFIRGFSYRTLVYLYGGVPLVINEVTAPKIDFVRASKEAVLNQAVEDLEFASQNLPGITDVVDGRVSNLVAYHYLAEVFITLGKNEEAILAATTVINDPNTALMTNRFGTRSSETDKDEYWDLFRTGNQNRSIGNTEGLWVIQFELDVPGGGLQSSSKDGSYMLERHHAPLNRSGAFNKWPVGDYTGGRGIGWMISTEYFSNTVWGGNNTNPDFVNDIRNANHNFMREYNSNNTIALQSTPGIIVSTETTPRSRSLYAYQTKATTPFNHPEGLYDNNDPYSLTSAAGGTYTDQYMLRLAETYLLRAEAYIANEQFQLAADDVNVVRTRANASEATAAQMDIDYILDERIREFGVEEKRRLTLMRLGLLYDRVSRFNPYYTELEDGMKETYNLWPIPADEIEGNREVELTQNPGYN
ncbi:RagB/SusD family nutrient uptake outer membrane protein [Mariniflexile litorale]|uniref:RagB/SusD family nutrient uptake outer membrane protein n=1 Tax=Mariniflexile litorale TaxID=3045158 RepID=A0AAU7EGD8_9FLAO|nr:RagB/SusD family nutrient uptake outer membrane protein [Mariniflexile sp. KMM 9835]MDQ8210864.1 RagB/SusD family nutrient uptake outer membrane protein [Mariniflexile sp. KMM 9835]